MRKVVLISLILLGIVTFFSCKPESKGGDVISEGKIEYDIEYLDDEKSNPVIALLPETMTFTFQDNISKQSIEGWMGVFKLSSIINVEKNSRIGYMKLMAKKLYYEGSIAGREFGYDKMPPFTFTPVDSTTVIAGYDCKIMKVSYMDSVEQIFYISYTDRIQLDMPNGHNPFGEIPGLVLEYRIKFFNINTHLRATKVEVPEEDFAADEFNVPEGFEKASIDEIYAAINEMIPQ